MNRREKILAAAVGGCIGLFVVGFGLRAIILQPVRLIERNTANLREKLDKIKSQRRAFFAAEEQIKAYTARTFADTVDQASAKSGEMLTEQILQCGLRETEFTRLPVGPNKRPGASEIGWSIQGDGALSNVVNLIFVMQESPWLHRIEGLSVSAGDAPGLVKVRFSYLTLVLDPAPEVERKELTAKLTLGSPERRLFDGLVARDVLRPYIKRPPPPPVAPASPSSRPGGGGPPAPPGPETFRVVSLSEWQGQPEVHVRDLVNQKTVRYKPGDELAGGTIVMVDYRSLPTPGNSLTQSSSRVILRVGGELWAIERGKTLADKRKLTAAEVPTELAKSK